MNDTERSVSNTLPTELQPLAAHEREYIRNILYENSDIPKGIREKGDRSKRFWNTLVKFVGKIDFKKPSGRSIEILDLACGECEEARALTAFFGGGVFGAYGSNVNFTGIDIEPTAIKSAIKENERFLSEGRFLPENYQFIRADATKLDVIEKDWKKDLLKPISLKK